MGRGRWVRMVEDGSMSLMDECPPILDAGHI